MEQVEPKNSPEALRQVACKICARDGITKMVARKGMTGHLGAHSKMGWTAKKYRETWGDEDFFHWINPPARQQASKIFLQQNNPAKLPNRGRRDGVTAALDQLNTAIVKGFSREEGDFYESSVDHLSQSTERDETQSATISSLVMDQIVVKRLRSRIMIATMPNASADDIIESAELEKTLKTTETRITTAMEKLGLTRDAQIKRGQVIKSTPASIISGYVDEIERMSPDMLDALELEEKRVWARTTPRIQKYILANAPDLEKKDIDDDASGRSLSFEEVLQRIGGSTSRSESKAGPDKSVADLPF